MSAFTPSSRAMLLAKSWDFAAKLYTRELAPRFLPWMHGALEVLQRNAGSLPPGRLVLVPCCGPGLEMSLISRCLGHGHPLLGVDLSQGMVDIANRLAQEAERTAGAAAGTAAGDSTLPTIGQSADGDRPTPPPGLIRAVVGDASSLHVEHEGQAAAVVSFFGLQQLGPAAPAALLSWVRCLAPGGIAIVVLWPSHVEDSGPWRQYDRAVQRLQQQQQQQQQGTSPAAQHEQCSSTNTGNGAPPLTEWERSLVEVVMQGVEDAVLLSDEMVQHDMQWPDVDTFWEVMTQGGPWHARRLSFGNAYMETLKALFVAGLAQEAGLGTGQQELLVGQHHPGTASGGSKSKTQEQMGVRDPAAAAARSQLQPAPATASIIRPLIHTPRARQIVIKRGLSSAHARL
mmetsp:Transcript_18121/g.38992  ORF Transcript_18121/g.38992 Transcript_18121/m.38992 type:complete len:400 (+) Transcript_18121:248-1447(+)